MSIGTAIGLILAYVGFRIADDYADYRRKNPPPRRHFSKKHATYEPDNEYVDGVGWCKRR